jgi:NTE family protein
VSHEIRAVQALDLLGRVQQGALGLNRSVLEVIPNVWDHRHTDEDLTEPGRPPGELPFRAFLLSEEAGAFYNALGELRLALTSEGAVGQVPDPGRLGGPGSLLMRTATGFLPDVADEWGAPLQWQRTGDEVDVAAVAYRGRAAGLMALGGLIAASGGEDLDPHQVLENMARIAFGIDPTSRLLGDLLSGHALPDPPRPGGEQPPLTLIGFEDLSRRSCTVGIINAGSTFGRVASQRPHLFEGAVITDVDPSSGCAGDVVTLLGNGFGATQPAGVAVMFPAARGGCIPAQVVFREAPLNGTEPEPAWSDTEIVVTVPTGVGSGCIGLVEYHEGFAGIAAAAEEFAGELVQCLGPVAARAADQIRASVGRVIGSACPDCADPGTVRFTGGPPTIRSFTVNGRDVAEIEPGDDVTVAWQVDNADAVTIEAGGGLPDVPAPYDPASGSEVIEDIELPDGSISSWRITATNRCGPAKSEAFVIVRGRKALVLSGGGAKGAFEVGAVRCLRDAAGVEFDIISGTSVGALNAAKLAEGGARALSDLERLWLDMRGSWDIYLEPPWFQRLSSLLRNILSAGSFGWGDIFVAAHSVAFNKMAGALLGALGIPGAMYSMVTAPYPVITGVVTLANYYDAIRQALAASSMFNFWPTAQKIEATIDPATVAASGIELRITAVSLQDGVARVFDQNGRELTSGLTVPLRQAVKASAAIPIAFPPVLLFLGEQPSVAPPPEPREREPIGVQRQPLTRAEHYVDGGLRENVPIAAAVEAGAHRVFAVLANPTEISPASGIRASDIVQVAGRTVDIFLHEAQRNDITPFQGFGVPMTIIAPKFLVNDTLQVDPGLISINMDYGYMRAHDEVVADPADADPMRTLAHEITLTRLEIWSTEYSANGRSLTITEPGLDKLVSHPVPESLLVVRTLKSALRTKVFDRINLGGPSSVPSGRARWWQQWERHPWPPSINTPWDFLPPATGVSVPAAPAPPA